MLHTAAEGENRPETRFYSKPHAVTVLGSLGGQMWLMRCALWAGAGGERGVYGLAAFYGTTLARSLRK